MTNVLPRAGGTLDQSPEFMKDLRKIHELEGKVESTKQQTIEIKKQLETAKGTIRSKL